MLTLNLKITALREARNLSQADLARRLNCTRSAINNYEQAFSTPSPDMLLALAGEFGVSVDYLLGNSQHSYISVEGLTESDVGIVKTLIEHLKEKNTAS